MNSSQPLPLLPDALAPEEPTPQAAALEASAPPAPPALNAAAEAAAFVARIFSEVATDGAQAEAAPATQPDAAATPTLPPAQAEPAPASLPGADWAPLAGQRVLVLGLGASGLAMARWCVRCGAQVVVADSRSQPPQAHALQALGERVRLVCGPFEGALVRQLVAEPSGLQAVYRSPGLSPAEIASVLEAANACQVRVCGEIHLFSQALHALRVEHAYCPTVLAITGTNGKTTVTALTGLLVESSGRSVAVAGNIGPTMLDTLAQALDAAALPQVWVLELSSFQLDGAQQLARQAPELGFAPRAATVLNLSQDHLDWHGTTQAYAQAKAQVFGPGTLMVLNREDADVMAMLETVSATHAQVGTARSESGGAPDASQPVKPQRSRRAVAPLPAALPSYLSFGADLPQRPGDFGMEVVNGMAWLVRAHEADETARPRRNAARSQRADEQAAPLHIQRLMPADALRIRGRHNATNALAALALAQAAGCALAPLLYALREYRGEPHRVEPVGMVGDVEYVDDSKGTNVGATVAALNGLGAERRLLVILGGDGKGQDFAPLAAPVARHARAVLLIGRDASTIAAALADCGVPLLHCASLPEAVQQAHTHAHAGDAVLLSPACASWDMFDHYGHRAQVFRDAVLALADEAGQPMLYAGDAVAGGPVGAAAP